MPNLLKYKAAEVAAKAAGGITLAGVGAALSASADPVAANVAGPAVYAAGAGLANEAATAASGALTAVGAPGAGAAVAGGITNAVSGAAALGERAGPFLPSAVVGAGVRQLLKKKE